MTRNTTEFPTTSELLSEPLGGLSEDYKDYVLLWEETLYPEHLRSPRTKAYWLEFFTFCYPMEKPAWLKQLAHGQDCIYPMNTLERGSRVYLYPGVWNNQDNSPLVEVPFTTLFWLKSRNDSGELAIYYSFMEAPKLWIQDKFLSTNKPHPYKNKVKNNALPIL